jgi:NADPH:quinone reductase
VRPAEETAAMSQAVEKRADFVSIPATMRALQQTSLKGPQDIRLITDAPVPSPGQGEVLIRRGLA